MNRNLDLVAESRNQLALLRDVHLSERDLYNAGDDLKQAVAVYISSWLPTLNRCNEDKKATASPPLDVAWVWHLHKLDPTSYRSDCHRWYGRLLDAPVGTSPFDHNGSLSSPVESATCADGAIDKDLLQRISDSARNQSSFLWHVRWPEYDNDGFLHDAVARYEMMLQLMKNKPTQFIVPTYDIDLMWHTHLAFPSRYMDDCLSLAGRNVNHDDKVGHDRSPNSFLTVSSAKTEQLWQATFGDAWRKNGAMYRGEPPAWFWTNRRRAAAPPGEQTSNLPWPAQFANCAIEVLGRAFGASGDAEVHTDFGLPCYYRRLPPVAGAAAIGTGGLLNLRSPLHLNRSI